MTEMLKFKIDNCAIGLDEGYRYVDSHHHSRLTTLLSYFVNQSRKRKVHFITNSQRAINVHPQIRDLAHIRIFCEGLGPNPDRPTHLRYTFFERASGRISQVTYATAKLQKAFVLYDPDEVYDIISGLKEQRKLKQWVRSL